MELATPPPSWKIPLEIAILFFWYSPNLNILSNKSQVSRQVQVCEKPNEHHWPSRSLAVSEYFNISSYLILFVDYHVSTSFRYYVSIALVRASSGAGELTEVLEDPTREKTIDHELCAGSKDRPVFPDHEDCQNIQGKDVCPQNQQLRKELKLKCFSWPCSQGQKLQKN